MERTSRRDYWRCVLELQAASNLSIRAFCEQEKIPYPSFFVWRRRLREVSAAASAQSSSAAASAESSAESSGKITFAPVTVVPPPPSPPPPASTVSDGIEIVLCGDRRVVLRGSVDRQALADVLAVLGVCVCGGGGGAC